MDHESSRVNANKVFPKMYLFRIYQIRSNESGREAVVVEFAKSCL